MPENMVLLPENTFTYDTVFTALRPGSGTVKAHVSGYVDFSSGESSEMIVYFESAPLKTTVLAAEP